MPNQASNSTKFIDVANSRYDDQRQVMEEILAAGHCPFCLENFPKYNPEPFIFDGEHWFLVKNKWPYISTKNHFLLIAKQHVETFAELSPAMSQELFTISDWAINKFSIEGGALALRFGDTRYSAATVKHLHAQLIHPDIFDSNFEKNRVRLTIGKAQKPL